MFHERVRALVLVTACWTGTPPPAPTSAPSSGPCRIREIDLETQAPVELRLRGTTFANLSGRFQRLDVSVVGSNARALVENETMELEGDLALEELPVRPSIVELRDGWLEITKGTARRATGDSLRFDVALPEGVEPRSLSFDMKCRELSFSEPPDPPKLAEGTRLIELVPGAVMKLRATPNGPVIATARASAKTDEERELRVVERRGTLLRVRFARPNAIVAWVDATSVRDHDELYGGLIGNLVGDTTMRLRCSHALPLYVRIGHEAVRVGRIKAGAIFEPTYRRDEVGIDLGAHVKAFVKPADTRGCSNAP